MWILFKHDSHTHTHTHSHSFVPRHKEMNPDMLACDFLWQPTASDWCVQIADCGRHADLSFLPQSCPEGSKRPQSLFPCFLKLEAFLKCVIKQYTMGSDRADGRDRGGKGHELGPRKARAVSLLTEPKLKQPFKIQTTVQIQNFSIM